MVSRTFWLGRIEEALASRSVLWLSGVRRAGKTTLCRAIEGAEYFDCELPRVRRRVEDDPESFLEDLRGKTIVLDEIHRLANPSEILKIAADHFRGTRVVATGSSTLGASARFKDTLAGRKRELWLTPMISADLADFRRRDLRHRLLRGGLPPMFLADELPERDYQEWLDAYWAKDVQELFRLERRSSFLRFAELLMVQSGGMFEATRFARPCEVSRTTIANYLAVLEATFLVHVVRPFSSTRSAEIVAAPKVYAFDTGFVCAMRGWETLRGDDLGPLWEHYVLNEIVARTQSRRVLYWRDKQGHEVDFVLARRSGPPAAIECKWSSKDFDATGLRSFGARYPGAPSFVVASDVVRSFTRAFGDTQVRFVGIDGLSAALKDG
jgi:uncharacterized protein